LLCELAFSALELSDSSREISFLNETQNFVGGYNTRRNTTDREMNIDTIDVLIWLVLCFVS